MLTFSRDQVGRAERTRGDAAIAADIRRHLRELRSAQVAAFDDTTLDRLVRAGMARARRHGFAHIQSLAAYTSLMFSAGPTFDEQPALAQHQAQTSRPERERLAELTAPDMQAAWDDAQRRYLPGDWRAVTPATSAQRETQS